MLNLQFIVLNIKEKTMTKQNSVEWIFERFESGDMYNTEDVEFIKHQALKMHREEIENAFFGGVKSTGEGWNGEYANGNNPDIKKEFTEGFEEWFEQFKK